MSKSVQRKKLKQKFNNPTLKRTYDKSMLAGVPKSHPENWKKLGNRMELVNLLNNDFDKLPLREEIDEISQSCYEHWLAAPEDATELNPMIINRKLQIGPCDTPLASVLRIHGTQVDGGSALKGLYRITTDTIMSRHSLQCSKACKNSNFKELLGTTYLTRFFKLVEGCWQIDTLGVYYQLRQFGGIKGTRQATSDAETQTDLGGEELDKLINMRSPES